MQPARLGAWIFCCLSATLGLLALSSSANAQTVLETPQQTNDKIRALSATAETAPHDYLIGRGDLLSIEVFDVPELTRDIRVSQTGNIGLPLVPVRLQMSGLTETQAAQKIAEVLEANGLVSHAQVSVFVKEKKSQPITIVGAVAHPLVYEADRPTTLLQALAQAQGIAPDAGDTVIVTRPDSVPTMSSVANSSEPPPISPEAGSAPANPQANPIPSSAAEPPPISNTITVNLTELLEGGDAKNNILLQGGDIVTVPHAGIVYVLGAVPKPGGFVATNDRAQLTTLKVLSLAGGLKITAKSDHAVIIRKDSLGQQREVPVDLAKVMKREQEDVKLLPSDILFIPDNKTKAAFIRAAEIALAVGTAVAIYRLQSY